MISTIRLNCAAKYILFFSPSVSTVSENSQYLQLCADEMKCLSQLERFLERVVKRNYKCSGAFTSNCSTGRVKGDIRH